MADGKGSFGNCKLASAKVAKKERKKEKKWCRLNVDNIRISSTPINISFVVYIFIHTYNIWVRKRRYHHRRLYCSNRFFAQVVDSNFYIYFYNTKRSTTCFGCLSLSWIVRTSETKWCPLDEILPAQINTRQIYLLMCCSHRICCGDSCIFIAHTHTLTLFVDWFTLSWWENTHALTVLINLIFHSWNLIKSF